MAVLYRTELCQRTSDTTPPMSLGFEVWLPASNPGTTKTATPEEQEKDEQETQEKQRVNKDPATDEQDQEE